MRKTRAELFVEKRKLVLFNLAVLALAFSIWWVIIHYNSRVPNIYDFKGMVVIVTVFYALMSAKTWSHFKKSPRLKLFDDGVELDHLGFWRWEDISEIAPSAKGPIFFLKVGDRDVPKQSKKGKNYGYEYDTVNNTASVNFSFPALTTNTPQDDFYKALFRQLQNAQKEEPNKTEIKKEKIKSFQNLFWGVENPSLIRILTMCGVWVALIVMLYGVVTTGFFPSQSWQNITNPLSILLSLSGTGAYYWAYKKGKIKLRHGQKLGNSSFVFLLIIAYFMSLVTLTTGFGRIYTEWYGLPTSKTITITEKLKGRGRKNCLKTKDLGGDWYSSLCVQKMDYDKIQIDSTLQVYGKEGWFGFVFQKYRILKL